MVRPELRGAATPERLPFGEVLSLEEGFENTLVKRLCTLGRFCELLLAVVQQHHASDGQHRQTLKIFVQAKGTKCIELLMDVNERLIAEICLLQETFEKEQKQSATTAAKKKAAVAAAATDDDTNDAKTTRLQQHLIHVHSVVVGVLSQLVRSSSQQQRRRGLLGGGGGGGAAAQSNEVATHIAKHFSKLVSGAAKAVQASQDGLLAQAKEKSLEKDPRATEKGQRLALRSFHRVTSIVAQLKSYLFDPQRRSATKPDKFGRLNTQAWHALVNGGVYESFLELSTWMVSQLEFWGYGGAVAVATGSSDGPYVNGAPPSKAELNSLLGKSFKTAAHASPLTCCDVNKVYAHGGGAWVCNACDGQQEGRIAFHHGPSDYDLCPACFYRKSQSGHQRVLFKTLTDTLTLMARVVEPSQAPPAPGGRDAAAVTAERALQHSVRKHTADFVGKLWSPEVLARCDADLTKQVLIVVGNTVTAERTAAVDNRAAADVAANAAGASSAGGYSMGSQQLSMLSSEFGRLLGPRGDGGGGGGGGGIRSSSNGMPDLANLLAGIEGGGRQHSGAVVRRQEPPAPAEDPPFVIDQSAQDMLVSMGFDVARAARVLEMTSNNLEAATELILMGGDLDPALQSPRASGGGGGGTTAAAAAVSPGSSSPHGNAAGGSAAAADTPADAGAGASTATAGGDATRETSPASLPGLAANSDTDTDDDEDEDGDDGDDAMEDSDDEEAMLARAIALSMQTAEDPAPVAAAPQTPATPAARGDGNVSTAITPSPATAATSPPTPPGRPSGASGEPALSPLPSAAAAAGAFGSNGSTAVTPESPFGMRVGGAASATPNSSVPQLDLSFLSAVGGSGGGGSSGAGASSSSMQQRHPSSSELSQLSQSLSGFLSSTGSRMSSSGIAGSGRMPMSSGAAGGAARAEQAKQEAEASAAASAALISLLTADALAKCLRIADRADITLARIQLTVLQALHGKTEAEAAEALAPLTTEAATLIEHVLSLVNGGKDSVPLAAVAADHQGFKLSVRLHLLTLLAAHSGTSAAVVKAASSAKLTGSLVQLFECTLSLLAVVGVDAVGMLGSLGAMPHYVTPLTVFLEQYDRNAVLRARDLQLRANARKKGAGAWAVLQPADDPDEDYWGGQRPKWDAFSASNAKKIEAAYCSGELSLDIVRHRQQFTIDFQRMQIAPTAVRSATQPQPVRRTTATEAEISAAKASKDGASSSTGTSTSTPSSAAAGTGAAEEKATTPPAARAAAMDVDAVDKEAKGDDAEVVALQQNALSFAQIDVQQHNILVGSCAQYLQHHLDADMLEATLRLAHRVTRANTSALAFARKGGLAAVLALRQAGMMDRSTVTLCALIIRHITDDATTLQQVIAAELRAMLAKCGDGKAYLTEILTETAHMASRHPKAYAAACASVFDLVEDGDASTRRQRGSAAQAAAEGDGDGDVTAGDAMVRARPFAAAASSTGQEKDRRDKRGGEDQEAGPWAGVASEGLTMVLTHVLDAIGGQFSPPTAVDTARAATTAAAAAASAMVVGNERSKSEDALSRHMDATYMLPIFQPYRLLKLLGELVASYPAAVPVLMSSSVASHSKGGSKVAWPTFLMHDVILRGPPPAAGTAAPATASPVRDDKHVAEECLYASQLLAAFTIGPAAAASQSTMVTLLKDALAAVAQQKRSLQSKNIVSIADLVNAVLAKRNIKVAGKASNPMSRLMVAAKVQAGLVALLRAADLHDPEVPKELNAVLRPLEVLTRFARAPARSSGAGNSGGNGNVTASGVGKEVGKGAAAAAASPTAGGASSGGAGASAGAGGGGSAASAESTPPATAGSGNIPRRRSRGGSRSRSIGSSTAGDVDDMPADFDVHDVPSSGSTASASIERGIDMVERLADELADELGASEMEVGEDDDEDDSEGDDDDDVELQAELVAELGDPYEVAEMLEEGEIDVMVDPGGGYGAFEGYAHEDPHGDQSEIGSDDNDSSDEEDDDDSGSDDNDDDDDKDDDDDDDGEEDEDEEEDGIIMDEDEDDAMPELVDAGGEGDTSEEEDDEDEDVPVRVMHHGDEFGDDDGPHGYMDQGFVDPRDEEDMDEYMMEQDAMAGRMAPPGVAPPHGYNRHRRPLPGGMPQGLADMLSRVSPLELLGGHGGGGAAGGGGGLGRGAAGAAGLSFNHPMLAAGGHGRAQQPPPLPGGAAPGWHLETDDQGRQMLTVQTSALGGPGGGAYNQRASQLLQSIMSSSRHEPELVEYGQNGQMRRMHSSRQSARAFLEHLVGGPLGAGGGGGVAAGGGAAEALATEHGGSGVHLVAEAGLDPMAGSSTDALSALPSLLSTLNQRAAARREQAQEQAKKGSETSSPPPPQAATPAATPAQAAVLAVGAMGAEVAVAEAVASAAEGEAAVAEATARAAESVTEVGTETAHGAAAVEAATPMDAAEDDLPADTADAACTLPAAGAEAEADAQALADPGSAPSTPATAVAAEAGATPATPATPANASTPAAGASSGEPATPSTPAVVAGAGASAGANTSPGGTSYEDEFLAALPPDIREEVMASRRAEAPAATAASGDSAGGAGSSAVTT